MTTVPASDKHYTARIIERKDLSEDLWLICVDPGGPFQFKAGQYATLRVDHEDKRIARAYSIVSSPYEQGLEFFIELVPQGALTPHLYKLQLGDTMFCRKVAKGRFTIDIKSGRTQYLLLATVTGIAPFVSYVRTDVQRLAKREQSHARQPQALLSARWKPLVGIRIPRRVGSYRRRSAVVQIRYNHQPPVGGRFLDRRNRTRRRLGAKVRGSLGLRPETTTAYLCGHPSMCENGQGILKRARLAERLHVRRGLFHSG
jgi:ferredoxin--NADP+ reductase